MVKFGERIKELGKRLGKDDIEIANAIGVSKSTMSHYINGRRKVPSEALQKLIDVYGINPQFLFNESSSLYSGVVAESRASYVVKNHHDYTYLPASISAGLPSNVEAMTNTEKINIPNTIMGKWKGSKDIYFMRINGDSMDKVMTDQSLIAVKPINLSELKNGDMVVFSNDYEYSVKYYQRDDDKLIFKPASNNDDHHDQIYNINDNITIHGKVVLYIVELD